MPTLEEFQTVFHALAGVSHVWTHRFFISSLNHDKTTPLLLEEVQQAAVGHVWHDNVGGGACIYAHANQAQHIGMVKGLHFYALVQNFVNGVFTE